MHCEEQQEVARGTRRYPRESVGTRRNTKRDHLSRLLRRRVARAFDDAGPHIARPLFVSRTVDTPPRLDRLDLETGEHRTQRTLRLADLAGMFYLGPAIPSGDGESYAYSYARERRCRRSSGGGASAALAYSQNPRPDILSASAGNQA